MPAVPKLLQIERAVRFIKVFGDMETHELSHAHGDIGITRKIAIYLHTVSVHRHERRRRTVFIRRGKHAIHQMALQICGHHYFLKKSTQYEHDPFRKVFFSCKTGPQLREKSALAHNGTAHHSGEKREKTQHLCVAARRQPFLSIVINGVRESLKTVK